MKILDRYSLNARFYPMVLFYMPVLLLGVLFSIQFEKYTHLFTSLGLLSALSFFLQQIGRDPGKKLEKSLWLSWGGAPSTQLLRWRDRTIDNNTKKRYHNKLHDLCPMDLTPSEQFEKQHPEEADAIYQAWVIFLITKTRDTNKFSLLFTENINYGFRRNLLGLKPYAITLLGLLMIIVYGYYAFSSKSINPSVFSRLFFIGEGALIILMVMWIVKVSPSWVRIPANAYAARLLENIDNLKNTKVISKNEEKKESKKAKKG
jgi:hypothetical protein